MFLYIKVPSHSSSALENSLQPWIGIYRKPTCTSIRQNTQTNLHCTVYSSIPVLSMPFLSDTKPPNLGIQNMFESRWYKLFAGIPSKASWHLCFWGEIFMVPVQAGADGHLTVLLLLLLLHIFQEMMADYMHRKGTREWLFLQDEFWLLSHMLSALMCRLWLSWMSDSLRSGHDEKPWCTQMVRDRPSHCAAFCQDLSSLPLDETSYLPNRGPKLGGGFWLSCKLFTIFFVAKHK